MLFFIRFGLWITYNLPSGYFYLSVLFLYAAVPKHYFSTATSNTEILKLSFPVRWTYDCLHPIISFINSFFLTLQYSLILMAIQTDSEEGYKFFAGCLSEVCLILLSDFW